MEGEVPLSVWMFKKYEFLPELWDLIWDYKCGFEDWELYCMYSRMVVRLYSLEVII